ncbi:MAG TPA: 2-amino-4-hydroxy-6-hydroxymethyldihydropteridine diphosphokinase [Devosia sp.]|nr:2-amino-4-hydroxy-6-hydroxymethyldihydropteridine diphosphokinase [Devosia sp.]
MAEAWLGLGANMENPPVQLEEAISRLNAHGEVEITARSSTLVNPPWGKTDQNLFHNLVLAVKTSLLPEELLAICLEIETQMGRVRREKWGPRLIDIDLIAYERLEIEGQRLTLPHPHAHQRIFVMSPLREIAPATARWIAERAEAAERARPRST